MPLTAPDGPVGALNLYFSRPHFILRAASQNRNIKLRQVAEQTSPASPANPRSHRPSTLTPR